ncbi:exodeoxyribonuclease III [Aggregicoccus sp. 17bor-14]|uniref:exodeoxyribonuclease III n=1 Tax=Myxococcaceae TaxID=31 RepID=UPI00129CBD39|nr:MULTISPECIES: exodeoxyribonuclease III [Myxococcaceae]MBF5042673.1 exodeoxyribonuclease III [Simulacricoccus sp. 17bor-14]MRI88441.1 exodeoxyribonuclease III [Aggregicoccus sp. 17bor-14]
MKIATWNVNSVRARQGRLVDWLKSAQPDVVCLQELKCTEADFPFEAVREAGYHAAVHGQKTYNGVAILARSAPQDVVHGLSDGVDDTHARVIAATVDGVRVLSVYAPNGQSPDSPAFQYKLQFYERLRRYLDTRHRPDEPLLLLGDWNVAPDPIDVYDPAAWEGQTLFTLEERAAFRKLCAFGLEDTFRRLYPEVQKFSWWDYRMLAFPKNKGVRIDHILATAPLMARCREVDVDRETRKGAQPSDHAAVWARFD